MNKGKAIEFLKQCLQEVPQLKKLNYVADDFNEREANRQKLNLWIDKCRNIIKEGLDPDDLKEFASWRGGHCKGFEEQEDYTGKLTDYETGLKSIIQKYEILGKGSRRGNLKSYLRKVTTWWGKIWRRVETHKIRSILGALASIATIVGVVILIINSCNATGD